MLLGGVFVGGWAAVQEGKGAGVREEGRERKRRRRSDG